MNELDPGDFHALDIGCGDGSVLARLQQLGANVQGIDLDAKSVSVAESRCGPGSCHVSTLEDYIRTRPEDAQGFDVVTFFEVLEHQVDPRGFLAQVGVLVGEGGLIAGSVPDRDRFLARVDRMVDQGDLPPHHFLWFSVSSLKVLLRESGFNSIEVRRVGALSFSDTNLKVREALKSRTLNAVNIPLWAAVALALIASPLPALVYWFGRRYRPSHLYFKCKA